MFLVSLLPRLLSFGLVAVLALLTINPCQASLFQHLDASVSSSFVDSDTDTIWLDQSGNANHATTDSFGSGSVALSTDTTVFPTGYSSLRFEGSNSANFGRLRLLEPAASDTVLDQSSSDANGFSVFVVARSDALSAINTWNDLIGNTTDVADGAFLMRHNEGEGIFQAAVGGMTVQNNSAGQNNYGAGMPSVFAFNYDPSQSVGEITLASSLNDYSQVFNLTNPISSRDFSNNDPLTLGKAFDNAARFFVGHVGEVKIYDTALSSSVFQAELDSLTTKWTTSPDGRLDLIVDRATGGITLHSPGSTDVSLVGLSLKSSSGSLDPIDWLSISDAHDADSGSPTVDADDFWLELSDLNSELSEATLGTTVITPGQSVDLGAAFALNGEMDLRADYADPDTESTRSILVRYINSPPAGLLPGDYNNDGSVNAADYTTWRDQKAQPTAVLANEVVSLGKATAEDYGVWAEGFGDLVPSQTATIPEPSMSALAFWAIAMVIAPSSRLRRSACVCFRRPILVAASLLALVMITPCQAQDITVGAYYYPWWDTHDWNETLRARMLPDDHRPSAGYTASSNPDLIAEHINQSHRGNISLWANSWWGPGSIEDTVLQNSILTHPRAGELKHAVHYETTGRFGSFSSPNYSNLTSDFLYLANSVFSDPNYYRIDGRPVVFMYVTRAYFDDPAAQQALITARQALQDSHGYDPYVVGDEIFGSGFNTSRASHFDAVTTFDVYAMSGMNDGVVTTTDVNRAATKYSQAQAAGANVIPGVTPGYNDRAVRYGNQATGRYYAGQTIAEAGEVFTDLIDTAALPYLDSDSDNLLLVNSFNEWHEDTQIEASVIVPSNNVDDTPTGDGFTQGVTYEGYGTKYLDLLRLHTTPGQPHLIDGDTDFDGDLDSDDLIAFVADWGSENLVNGVRTGGYNSRISQPDFNYDGVVDFKDWFVMRRAHPSVNNDTLATLLAVPEPGSLSVIAFGIVLALGSNRRDSRHRLAHLEEGDSKEC